MAIQEDVPIFVAWYLASIPPLKEVSCRVRAYRSPRQLALLLEKRMSPLNLREVCILVTVVITAVTSIYTIITARRAIKAIEEQEDRCRKYGSCLREIRDLRGSE